MKVYYDESPAGAGKTERAIAGIVRQKSKTIFVTERKESFGELERRVSEMALEAGTRPVIQRIHGGTINHGGSVSKEIGELPSRYANGAHTIGIITHAALLQSDFSGFEGWRMIIDEVPAFLDFDEKGTHLDVAYFERHYILEQVSEGWRAVTLTNAGHALSVADVRADQSHDHLTAFHSRVIEASRPGAKRHVLCNLPDWQAMADRAVKWCWASVFSLKELAAFERVELLGNRFRSDIGSVLTQFFDSEDVEWEPIPPLLDQRQFIHRMVHIHFFTDRPASKSFFADEVGQRVLRDCGKLLAEVLPQGKSIWSANDTAQARSPTPRQLLALPAGSYLSPKQAGTNRYAGFSHAAIIYAAKPSPNLRSLLKALGVDSDVWTRSVEHETILQFVTRTSVRDPNNATPVNLYVFDAAQAGYLKDYFDALPHVTTQLSRVPLNIDIPAKKKGGRPRHCRTPEQDAAFRAEKREKDRERKKAARAKSRIEKTPPSADC